MEALAVAGDGVEGGVGRAGARVEVPTARPEDPILAHAFLEGARSVARSAKVLEELLEVDLAVAVGLEARAARPQGFGDLSLDGERSVMNEDPAVILEGMGVRVIDVDPGRGGSDVAEHDVGDRILGGLLKESPLAGGGPAALGHTGPTVGVEPGQAPAVLLRVGRIEVRLPQQREVMIHEEVACVL